MGIEPETATTSATGMSPAKAAEKESHGGSTAHLKIIPQEKELRLRIREESARIAATLDRARPLTREMLQRYAGALMAAMDLPQGYLGFVMVAISNEFWREQFMAVDFSRRLLLLPHCLKHIERCPAEYDEVGMKCADCGECIIGDFKVTAERLGYKVLVAEGTPIVLRIITGGEVDAILGVSCLNVLERALDKALKVGVPSLAAPLLSSDCKNTSVDEDWVAEMVQLRSAPPKQRTRTYLPLLRAAKDAFETARMEMLLPRTRKTAAATGKAGDGSLLTPDFSDPIAATEALGCDWLGSGGKRFRPFITLAAYDAMLGGKNTVPGAVSAPVEMPDAVRRVAMAMEVFHKASLIHDDIEDDDAYRYGRETLHRRHGVPTAINVGDYLVGLGYRIVSREAKSLGAAVAADILDRLAQAHQKLAEGQGAELFWRDAAQKDIAPLDELKIYALKTAPAFEAALYAGMRLAGPTDGHEALIADFSRNLGVAFQILNDLEDWDGDDNKLMRGQDVLSARPTLLLALALESAAPEQKAELRQILHDHDHGKSNAEQAIRRVRQIYAANRVFEKAETMVSKYRERCEALADEATPAALRELLYFLVDTVLERELPEPEPATIPLKPALRAAKP